jgi:hypothetical protein
MVRLLRPLIKNCCELLSKSLSNFTRFGEGSSVNLKLNGISPNIFILMFMLRIKVFFYRFRPEKSVRLNSGFHKFSMTLKFIIIDLFFLKVWKIFFLLNKIQESENETGNNNNNNTSNNTTNNNDYNGTPDNTNWVFCNAASRCIAFQILDICYYRHSYTHNLPHSTYLLSI